MEFHTRRFGCTVTYSCAGAVALVESAPLPPAPRYRRVPLKTGALWLRALADSLGLPHPPCLSALSIRQAEETLENSARTIARLFCAGVPEDTHGRFIACLLVILDEVDHAVALGAWQSLCHALPSYREVAHGEPTDAPPRTAEYLEVLAARAARQEPLAHPGDAWRADVRRKDGGRRAYASKAHGHIPRPRCPVEETARGPVQLREYRVEVFDKHGAALAFSDDDGPLVRPTPAEQERAQRKAQEEGLQFWPPSGIQRRKGRRRRKCVREVKEGEGEG